MNMMLAPPPPKAPLDSDALYEIIDGEKVEVQPMSKLAGIVASQINRHLCNWQENHSDVGMPTVEGLFFMPVTGRSRRPDVAFIRYDRYPYERVIEYDGDYPMAPDLAVEVISPHDLSREVEAKIEEYFANGVSQVWMVHPETQKIKVYDSPVRDRILHGTDVLTSDLLPGFHVTVEALFPKLPVKS